mmetsp:Transcript_20312/g.34886  ORF Transcript_20312/g.34886 Transcript_20312/m.34886 type:complete len:342 (+) Transcript_20312:159-1184(+)
MAGNLVQQQREEQRLDQKAASRKRDEKWTYQTLTELHETDPSVKDGLAKNKAAAWRRSFVVALQRAGMALKIPQWGIGMAMTLCHRFFSRKSMKVNDRVIIATACLHLAAKMEECPKPIRDVVKEMIRVKCKDPVEVARLTQPEELEKSKEEALMAERLVLYTLGFDLSLNHPYRFLVSHLSELKLLQVSNDASNPLKHLMQNTWNLVNDSFRTQLCLQFKPEKIAASALYLSNLISISKDSNGDVMKRVEQHHRAQYEQQRTVFSQDMQMARNTGCSTPLDLSPYQPPTFFSYFDVTLEEVDEISAQIMDMYLDIKLASTLMAEELKALQNTAGSGQVLQ